MSLCKNKNKRKKEKISLIENALLFNTRQEIKLHEKCRTLVDTDMVATTVESLVQYLEGNDIDASATVWHH